MKVYIAGPMTGIPQFNFPAFEEAATSLRAAGYEVVSPHERDSPDVRKEAWASPDGKIHGGKVGGETWGDMLARDVKIIADEGIEGIVFLGLWGGSKGALLESVVGLLCGLKHGDYIGSGIVHWHKPQHTLDLTRFGLLLLLEQQHG